MDPKPEISEDSLIVTIDVFFGWAHVCSAASFDQNRSTIEYIPATKRDWDVERQLIYEWLFPGSLRAFSRQRFVFVSSISILVRPLTAWQEPSMKACSDTQSRPSSFTYPDFLSRIHPLGNNRSHLEGLALS